jgi:hypothetical protein
VLEIHGDAYVFGGYASGYENSAIYQITCSSGICSLSTLNQELKVARYYNVAIGVTGRFCPTTGIRLLENQVAADLFG